MKLTLERPDNPTLCIMVRVTVTKLEWYILLTSIYFLGKFIFKH